mmetsp:Transcript_24374/g.34346  ORF Transcript_24374/g.34346 Transcript_24374/m.34346 type:complete len:86 (+) Transcript_24374:1890-2147(+)
MTNSPHLIFTRKQSKQLDQVAVSMYMDRPVPSTPPVGQKELNDLKYMWDHTRTRMAQSQGLIENTCTFPSARLVRRDIPRWLLSI